MKQLQPVEIKPATWIERAVTAETETRFQKAELARLRASMADLFMDSSEQISE